MTIVVFFTLFSVCLLGAMSPGPSLAVVTKHALSGGRFNGLCTAWAHASGVFFYALLTSSGLAVLLQHSPLLFKALTWLGAGYLAYLGVKSLMSKGGIQAQMQSGKKVSALAAAGDGLAISLFNPKIALFFIALFSQFIGVAGNMAETAVIVATPALIDGLWYTLVAVVMSSQAVVQRIQAKAGIIDKVTGGVLILLALKAVSL